METANSTDVKAFLLLGLSNDRRLQVPLFLLFLVVYIITVLDSIGIVVLCLLDPHLHKPMYFFISNLSFVDLCYSTTITPKLLMGFLVETNTISITGCAGQLFFFSFFCIAEFILLTVMAFDCYAAICRPLHYTALMTKRCCTYLAAGPYVCGRIPAAIYTVSIFQLPFCGSTIPHYFCDLLPLLSLSCMDPSVNELIVFTIITSFGSCNILALSVSYTYIIIGILRISSSTAKHKVASTCSPHFVSVVLFYGTSFYVYLRPNALHSDEKNKGISIFYTIIMSMLNPLIYSLRNKDVKASFWRTVKNKLTLHQG